MVAAERDECSAGVDDSAGCLRDGGHRVFNGSWNHGDVTVIHNFEFLERSHVQGGVMPPDHQRCFANLARAKTSPGAVGCTAIKRHTHDGKVNIRYGDQ